MLEKLRDCHEKQSIDGNPCLQEDLKGSLSALYKRGLIDTKIAGYKWEAATLHRCYRSWRNAFKGA